MTFNLKELTNKYLGILSGAGKTLSNLIPPVAGYRAIKTIQTPQFKQSVQPIINTYNKLNTPTAFQQKYVIQPTKKWFQETTLSQQGEWFPKRIKSEDLLKTTYQRLSQDPSLIMGITSPFSRIKPTGTLKTKAILKAEELAKKVKLSKSQLTDFYNQATKGGWTDVKQFDTPEIIKAREISNSIPKTIEINTPERVMLRDNLATKLYGNGAVNKARRVDIVLGSPASGKSSKLVEPLAKQNGSLIIDSDQVKKLLPEYQNGLGSNAVHKESALIADDKILERAILNGDNIVFPRLGKNPNTMRNLVDTLKEAGYDIHLHYVDLPAEEAAKRVVTRFNETGRFVDPEYILKEVDGKPKMTYNQLKNNDKISSYEAYDNNVPFGQQPKLIEKGTNERAVSNGGKQLFRQHGNQLYPQGNIQTSQVNIPQSTKGGEVTKPITQISRGQLGRLKAQPVIQEVAPKIKDVGGTEVSALSKPLKTPVEISGQGISSTRIIPQKYAENINLNKLNLTQKEKTVLKTTVDSIKPQLEKIKGKTLTNKEVLEAAKKSDILTKVTTRDETLAAEASILKARQRLVELDKSISNIKNPKKLKTQMTDLVDSLKVVSGNAADAGRKLQSLAIEAEDQSIRQTILKEIGRTEKDTAKIVEEALKVNWNDANSITAFYRKFIKPSTMEILDEYRYNNMLSNPRTHLRNAFSNLVQTFITRPGTLLASGRPIEMVKYYTGALSSFPDAVDAFAKSFKGIAPITKPDIAYIGTKKLPKFLTIPTRAMEAGDKFFSALIKGGELARGATAQEAAATAEYSLFRQGLFPKGQGKLLNAIDSITSWTYKAPKAVRWFVPFIRTPMNFAKQWIEYSPAGLANLPGSIAKREQLGKVVLGSTISAIGAKFALDGNTTWDAPTDPKQKELFYASGRKPFSVRIGNRWVSMMYAGPFAMAFALPAAVKFYQDESRTALTDSQMKKLGNITMSMAKYLSGQTFMEGIGNFVKFFSGDADYSLAGNLAFTAGQVIPMEGLVRWITTMVDPVYRKGTSFMEGLQKNLPFVSKGLPAYTTPEGLPSTRERLNLITPYDISTNKPSYEPMLQQRTTKLQQNAVENKIKKDIESSQGETQVSGNKVFYWDPDSASVKTLDITPIAKPKLTGQGELDKIKISSYNSKLSAQIKDIAKLEDLGQITAEEAEKKIKELTAMKVTKGRKVPKPSLKIKALKVPKLKVSKVKKIKIKTKKLKKYKLKVPKLKKSKIKLSAKLT